MEANESKVETEVEIEDGVEVTKTKTYSDGVLISESTERRAVGEAEAEAKSQRKRG